MTTKLQSNRRSFLKTAGASAAWLGSGAAAPLIVPSNVFGQDAPSNKLVVGNIGLGWRGSELLRECLKNENIQVAALCDLDFGFLSDRLRFVDDQTGIDRKWVKGTAWDTIPAEPQPGAAGPYIDYGYLLDRKDIDAVLIAVPDHWHAKLYMDAMDAGKDVYGEKPLTLTIAQGRKVVNKSKETGRIFQVGFQQRQHKNFQTACEYVRNGRLGKLQKIRIIIGGTRFTAPVPDAPVPPGLNWDKWLGSAPAVPFNPLRCHIFFRYFFEYSGGQITDLGAHHTDIAQWAMDMDGSGPRFVEGTCAVRKDNAFNTFTKFNFKLTYDNGVDLFIENGFGFDMIFYGDKGEIFVNRSKIYSTPDLILKEPMTANDKRFVSGLELSGDEGYSSSTFNHIQHWVDCVKNRKQSITDAEIGQRSATVSHLANICGWLGGRRLEWDAKKEQFVNDEEANAHLTRPERAPYGV
ncbi:MAG: Gfo/Idh/MocA family oxidoreductase [Candidatus Omnitrophota bacterium]